MVYWYYSTRDGSIKGSVAGQLASGRLQTFIWNCLWTLFNTTLYCKKTFPDFSRRIKEFYLAAAGDDCYFCLPDGMSLKTGSVVTPFMVTLKISSEPHRTIFCHHVMTKEGAFLDPIRLLAKFFSKPLERTNKSMLELKNALNALCGRYRDADQASRLYDAFSFDQLKQDHIPLALDLIFRICNTPEKKLSDLLITTRVKFIYRELHM